MKRNKCLIVGYGRFGRVMARILKDNFDVCIRESTKIQAQVIKDDGFTPVAIVPRDTYEAAFLCVPISAIAETLEGLRGVLHKSTLVIDTCSVKVFPMEMMKKYLKGFQYLGTHPLFGPDSIKNGLTGKKVIICGGRLPERKLQFWSNFWKSKGANVIELTPEEHDRQAAYSQGLTHFIGRVLGGMDIEKDVTTKGSENLAEIIKQTNNDTWELFDDLQLCNPYTKQMRNDFDEAYQAIKARLDKLIDLQIEDQ